MNDEPLLPSTWRALQNLLLLVESSALVATGLLACILLMLGLCFVLLIRIEQNTRR